MSTQSHQSQARGSLALCSPGGLRSLSGEESPADPRGARWPLPPTEIYQNWALGHQESSIFAKIHIASQHLISTFIKKA